VDSLRVATPAYPVAERKLEVPRLREIVRFANDPAALGMTEFREG